MNRLLMLTLITGTSLLYSFSGAVAGGFEATVKGDSLHCAGDKSGRILVQFRNGNPGCLCILSSDSLFGKQLRRTAFNRDTVLSFSQLEAGTYYLLFKIQGGITERRRATVSEPAPLLPGLIVELKGCSKTGARDAVLEAHPSGGTPPYSFQWGPEAGNQQGALASNLIEGVHRCLITDSRNCGPVQAVYFLQAKEE